MDIYVTGKFGNYGMDYAFAVKEDGKLKYSFGRVTGSKPEAEVSAIGIALKYAVEKDISADIHTDFETACKWANHERSPISKTAKDFVKYVNHSQRFLHNTFTADLVPEMKADLLGKIEQRIEKNSPQKTPFKKEKTVSSAVGWHTPPQMKSNDEQEFRVIVRRPNGEIVCDVTQDDFCNVEHGEYIPPKKFAQGLKDAIYFADYYENVSAKDKNDFYYGVTVERINVPTGEELQKKVEAFKEKKNAERLMKQADQLELF